ncbi:hypothetical protein VTL71DRAFT_6043 [Oculimacula yallundae]|uniref:Uncharacterized protein n=1 Tax=Oculimacula yallundae TaxID=86028 RepID=A0ABR4C0Q8_9HELO
MRKTDKLLQHRIMVLSLPCMPKIWARKNIETLRRNMSRGIELKGSMWSWILFILAFRLVRNTTNNCVTGFVEHDESLETVAKSGVYVDIRLSSTWDWSDQFVDTFFFQTAVALSEPTEKA